MKNPQHHAKAVELAETLVTVINSVLVSSTKDATRADDKITAHLHSIGDVDLRVLWTDDMAGFHLTEVCGIPGDRNRAVYVNPDYPVDMQDVAFKILPILCHEAKMVLHDSKTPKPVANPVLEDALTELRSATEQFTGPEAEELSAIADGIELERAQQLTIPQVMSEDEVLALITEVAEQVGTEHGQLRILTAAVNTAIHRHAAHT